jgi:hypothetical protein
MRLCKLVDFYQRFGGTCCLRLRGRSTHAGKKDAVCRKGGQCRGLENSILCCRLVVNFCSETDAYKLIPCRHTMWNSCHAAQVYENIILFVRHRKLWFSVSYSEDIAFKSRLGYLLVFLSAPKHAGILTYHTPVRLRTFPYTCFPIHVSLSSSHSILYNFRS